MAKRGGQVTKVTTTRNGEVSTTYYGKTKFGETKAISTSSSSRNNFDTDRQIIEAAQKAGQSIEDTARTESGGISIAREVRKEREYVSQQPGVFINPRSGEGFSADPGLVVREVRDKGFGSRETTYFSGEKKFDRPSDAVDVYGVKFSPQAEQVRSKSNVFEQGLSNVNILGDTIQSERAQQRAEFSGRTRLTPGEYGRVLSSDTKAFGVGFLQGAGTPIFRSQEFFQGFQKTFTDPMGTFSETRKFASERPTQFLGQFAGGAGLQSGVFKVAGLGREGFILSTSKVKPYSEAINIKVAGRVAAGEKAFPLSGSVEGALINFEKSTLPSGEISVISASEAPVSTLGQTRLIKVGAGTGIDRTEGLYATSARTGGSPFFLRVAPSSEGAGLSLLPKLSRPTIQQIGVKGVSRIPQSVLKQGVAAENLFLERQAGSSVAYITGNLERRFNPSLPKGFKTSEEEVVIPKGTILRSTSKSPLGYEESFVYGGRVIPIRPSSVVGSGKVRGFSLKNVFKETGRLESSSEGSVYYLPRSNVSLSRGFGIRLSPYSYKSSTSSGELSYKPYSSVNRYSSVSSLSSVNYPSSSIKYPSSTSSGGLSRRSTGYSSLSSLSSQRYTSAARLQPPTTTTTFSPKYRAKPVQVKKSSANNFKVNFGYTASVEAGLLGIRGKPSRFARISGLSTRPLVK